MVVSNWYLAALHISHFVAPLLLEIPSQDAVCCNSHFGGEIPKNFILSPRVVQSQFRTEPLQLVFWHQLGSLHYQPVCVSEVPIFGLQVC